MKHIVMIAMWLSLATSFDSAFASGSCDANCSTTQAQCLQDCLRGDTVCKNTCKYNYSFCTSSCNSEDPVCGAIVTCNTVHDMKQCWPDMAVKIGCTTGAGWICHNSESRPYCEGDVFHPIPSTPASQDPYCTTSHGGYGSSGDYTDCGDTAFFCSGPNGVYCANP